MGLEILLFVPNIIGYLRLILLVSSWIVFYSYPFVSINLYIVSAIFDAVDGFFARKLDQTSAFGAWLDVVVDIIGRGMLWSRLYPNFGFLLVSVEWLTFVCTHKFGAQWKVSVALEDPSFVKEVMRDNFRSPLGVAAITGLHVLPIWLYLYSFNLLSTYLKLSDSIQIILIILGAACRALCLIVELWCIYKHIWVLLQEEKSTNSQTSKHTVSNM